MNTFARKCCDGLLPAIVMVMPIMMVMMMVILHPDDLGLRRDGCDATEEEQSEQEGFHNIFYLLM